MTLEVRTPTLHLCHLCALCGDSKALYKDKEGSSAELMKESSPLVPAVCQALH